MTSVQPAEFAVKELTEDAFLGDALHMLQPARGYRAGLDAVLLAAAAPVPTESRPVTVLDVGAGVGVVGLCLARRCPQVRVTLVERDPDLADLARKNVDRNALAARVNVVTADVTQPLSASEEMQALAETFDLVLSNPPYHHAHAGTSAADAHKAASHAMPAGTLERWLRFMASMTRPGGAMGIVHRADALADLLDACRRRFGAVHVRPLHPHAGAPANRILLTATRGSRAPLTLAAGLVLHGPDGRFMPGVEAALRHGAALT